MNGAGLLMAGFALLTGACQPHGDGRKGTITEGPTQPFAGIGEDETIRLLGTEPFWGAEIAQGTLTYTTPESGAGIAIPVTRFAGNGGLGFSGMVDGAPLQLAVTPGECSDGMSDRKYPLAATLAIGDRMLLGCGYSDRHPYTGEE